MLSWLLDHLRALYEPLADAMIGRRLRQAWRDARATRAGSPEDLLAREDPNGKCPACGHREGEIRWAAGLELQDGSKGAVVHQCHICKAPWFKKPLVPAAKWAIEIPELPKD